jgi:DNA adenine methylase
MELSKKSLLRYPGGKTRAVKILEKFIPSGTKEICSPFFGGGSFEIHLASKGLTVHGYDNFDLLVNFWKKVLTNKDELVKEVLKKYPLEKDTFYRIQKSVLLEQDPMVSAALFYVLNRCSFSGTGLSGGMSPKHPRFGLSQIANLQAFKSSFTIEKESFQESIKKHDCLIYADPPYLIPQSLYGVKGSMHKGFDHFLLSKILKTKGNFLLSYNDCPEIRKLYEGCEFHSLDWAYGMNRSKKSNELLITMPL